jgi:type I restriction enzyme S subunit
MLLDIRPDHLQIVQAILQKHIPEYEVWAFGSRAKWTAKEYSDLDLCVITKEPLSFTILGLLAEDFTESDLPWKVDVLDWSTTAESFQKIIEKDKVVIQKAAKRSWVMSLLPEISLKDAVEFIVDNRGKTAPTESFGIALIATNCVNNNDLYPRKENLRFVSQDTYDNWFRAHPKPRDILLTNKGSQNGAICLVPDIVDFCIAQDMVALRANSSILEPLYLFAALRSELVQNRIKALNVDAVIPHFKKTDFDKLFIPLPDKNTQAFIGDFYFELSSRIQLLKETNSTLEAIAQALFKSWFVDFDPVHAKMQGTQPEGMDEQTAALFPDSFEESELGLEPLGWEVGTLGGMSKNNSTPFDFSKVQKVVFVNTGDVSNGEFLHQNYSLKEGLPGQAKKAIYEDDILFSEIRPKNGRFAYVNFDAKDYVVSTKFMVLRAINNISPRYLYQVLRQTETIEYFHVIAESRSGTFPQITFDSVKNYKLIKPSSVCLEKYIECVNPIFHKVDLLNKQAQTLADLRDTLLPRLISGQLRVGEFSV